MHLLLFLVALLGSAVAQEGTRACSLCSSTGRLPCSEHPAAECAFEDRVLYCSVVAGCEKCGGAGFVPCGACKRAKAGREIAERRARIEERAVALQPIDDTMGRPLRKAETSHFVFVWEKDEHKIGKRRVPPHEALHVYADRSEALFSDYCGRLSVDEAEFREKVWVFVWYLPKDHEEGTKRFCEMTPEKGGVKVLGIKPRYSVCANPGEFRTDEQLHRNIVHSLTHLLLSHQTPTAWIGNMKGGWADEGLAHWFEDRVSGICDNYCMQEDVPNPDFEKGRYRLGVRKMVAKEAQPPMADVTTRNVDTLTVEMNAVVFSYIDYLMTLGGEKLDTLIKKLKARVPTAEAVREIYGMNILDLEAKWQAWVLETYPTR